MSEFTSKTTVQPGSEKNFGRVFASVSAIVAVWLLWKDSGYWVIFAILALVFIGLATFKPSLLRGPNRLWFKFGMLLHSIISPIVMGAVYLITFLPFGIAFKLMGKDPLARGFDADAESYWKVREDAPQSMRRQF